MIVAGALAMLCGVAFGMGSLIFAVIRFSDSRLLTRLLRAPRVTCGQLVAADPLPRYVLVRGRTAAGPEGVLVSPAFGTPCAWYETEVWHNDGGDSSTTLVHEVRGGAGISLTDPTGAVMVHPDLFTATQVGIGRTWEGGQLQRAAPDSGLRRLEASGRLRARDTRGLLWSRELDLTERVVPLELEVSVLARPRRRGGRVTLTRPRGALSRHPPDAWIDAVRGDRRTAAGAIVAFPLVGVAFGVAGAGLMWLGLR